MKRQKHVSKKFLALFMSLLMVLTTITLAVIPSSAVTGVINPSNWQAVCGSDYGMRADGTKVVVTSDGEAGNSSVGLIKFPISGIPSQITGVILNVQAMNHGGNLANSTVQIYSIDPSKFNTSVSRGGVVDAAAFCNIFNSNTMATNLRNHFGCSSSTSLGTITQNTPGTYSFDIASAINAAKAAGQSELCLLFMMPQCYNDNNSNTWSDVQIIIDGTNITYSDVSIDTSNIAEENLNEINSISNFNDDVTTIHGNFKNDGDCVTADYYNAIYKNILYSPTVNPNTNDVNTGAAVKLDASCYWNKYYARWFHAETVMMYDGVTIPSTGIMMLYSSCKNAWNGNGHTHLISSYMLNGNGLALNNWHGPDNGRNSDKSVRLNMQWTWHATGNAGCLNYKHTDFVNYSTAFDNQGKENGLANTISYTGGMDDNEWSKTIYPTYGFTAKTHDQASNNSGVQEAQSSIPFHIINYKPLKAAINSAIMFVDLVKKNPANYDPIWVSNLSRAANALIAAKPNNFIYECSKDISGYAEAAKAAVEQFNAVGNPVFYDGNQVEPKTYRISYKTADGDTTLKEVEYKCGSIINPKTIAPKNSLKENNNSNSHIVYSWNNVPTLVTVSDNIEYVESVASEPHNLNYESVSTTQHKSICLGCGYESNPTNHALSRINLADNHEKHQVKCSLCEYDVEEAHNYGLEQEITSATCAKNQVVRQICNDCSHVREHEVENTKTDNHTFDIKADKSNVVPDPDNAGKHIVTCTVCDTSTITVDCTRGVNCICTDCGRQLAHELVEQTAAIPANCQHGNISAVMKCRYCDYTEGGVDDGQIDAVNGHDFSENWTTDIEATCETVGSKSHHCSRCNERRGVTEIQPLGHSFTNYVSDNNATCTKNGTQTAFCDKGCGKTDTKEIENSKSRHEYELNFDNYPEKVVAVCKTCSDEKVISSEKYYYEIEIECTNDSGGWDKSNWSVLGKDRKSIVSVFHEFVAPINFIESKTVDSGYSTYFPIGFTFDFSFGGGLTWRTMDATFVLKVGVSASDYIEIPLTLTTENHKGSHTIDGQHLHSSSTPFTPASAILTAVYTHDHVFDDGVVTKPTCVADGYTTYTCSNCVAKKIDSIVEKLGHDYLSEHVEAKDDEEGYTLYTCTRCGDTYTVLDPAVAVDSFVALSAVNSINLSWLKAVEASVTGYEIFRKVEGESDFELLTTIDSRNTLSYVDSNLSVDKEYSYKIRAMKNDVAGEFSDIVTTTPDSDTIKPIIKNVSPSNYCIKNGSFKIEASSEDNVGVVLFKVNISYDGGNTWDEIFEKSGSSISFNFDTTKYNDGEYQIKLVAIDEAGNESDGYIINCTFDNSGPEKVAGVVASDVYSSKLTLKWNDISDKDKACFVLQEKNADGTYTTISSSITTLGYNISKLTPDTTYTYRVAAMDIHGNIGEFSDDIVVTTLQDTSAPVVTKVLPNPGRYNKTINFSVTAEDDYNIQKLVIIASQDLNDWRIVDGKTYDNTKSSRSQSFTISLDDFEEGNLYLAAIAYDTAGNTSPRGEEAAYVQYIVDKTAPVAPTNVTAEGRDRQIVVTWSQGTETDLGKYNVYRSESENGEFTLVASNLAKLDYFDSSVKDGVTYYYKVAVSDSCGNMSKFSDVVFANLNDDTEKPVINSVGLGYGTVAGPSNSTVGVVAQDNKWIRRVVIEYRLSTDSNYTVLSDKTYDENQYYRILEANLPLSEFSDGDKVYVRAYCVDSSGLVSDYSMDNIITIDKTAPTVKDIAYTANANVYTITWSGDGEKDINGYKVYYAKNNADYKLVASRSYNSAGKYAATVSIDSGAFDVKIVAVDKVGNSAEFSALSGTITGSNNFILEAIIDCPAYFEIGVQETISAAKSISSDKITSYTWDFGDGSTSTLPQFNKRYSKLGSYEIKLTIVDENGNTATASKSITVKEREMLGTVSVTVVDESSNPIPNAEVYFDLGAENQIVKRTNGSGVTQMTMSVGQHDIGAIGDLNSYLPTDDIVNILAGKTTEVTLVLIEKPLIDMTLDWHEMTFDEIIAAGIDVSDPANRQLISGTITVKYGKTQSSGNGEAKINYVAGSGRIIDYDVSVKPGTSVGNNIDYSFSPVIVDKDIVAVLVAPVSASFLSQFFEVTLCVSNNATDKFSISECGAELSVPSGLSIVRGGSMSSVIPGNSSSSATWILRGDEPGSYDLDASFVGKLDLFNKQVSANVSTSSPLEVRGLEGITLRAVFNTMIKNNSLYYNLILENDSGYDIYYPNIDYKSMLDNLMFYAPKKDKDAEIKTECLGVSLIDADGIAETFDVDKEFDILHDGEKIKYEFKTVGLANDDVTAYYSEGIVDCLPKFKDHIVVEEDYIYSYDGEEEIVKYTEKYKDVFKNGNGIVLRFFEQDKLLEGEIDYIVGSKDGDLRKKLKQVTVEYGNGKSQIVDEEFAAKYGDIKGYDIVVKADGYRIKVIPAETIEKWSTHFSISQKIMVDDIYLEKDHKDGKPYIVSAYGKENNSAGAKTYSDLMTGKLSVTGGTTCDIILKAAIGNKELDEAVYWISQDNIRKVSSESGVFSNIDIKKLFDKNEDIYAYVVAKDGEKEIVSEPIKLGIEILELSTFTNKFLKSSTITLLSSKGQTMDIGDDTPLIGGSKISTNTLSYPIGVEVQGKKVRISLGVDIFSKDFSQAELNDNKHRDDFWKQFKGDVAKWERDNKEAMKKYDLTAFGTVANGGGSFKLDFYGYIEGEFVNGTIVPTGWSASLKGAFSYKYTQQGAIFCIPAYAYAKADLPVSVKASQLRQLADENVPFDFGIELKIAPSLRVGGGAGINGVVSAGVFANGVLEYLNNFSKQYHKLKLTGTFGAEAEFFFLKCEKPLLEGSWTPINSYYGESPKQKSTLKSSFKRAKSETNSNQNSSDYDIEIVSRDYLQNMSEWNNTPIKSESIGANSGTLMKNVYSGSNSQMVQFGNKMMQVFIEDDAARDNYNFARLMYSVYDAQKDSWSTPKAVYDDGHFDSSPKLCSDAKGNVYLVWQKLDTTFDKDNATIDNILKHAEIFYAKYDASNDRFVDATKLTDDDLYDSTVSMCIENNKPVVYWIKNKDNNLLNGHSNSLMRCAVGSAPEVIVNNLNYVADVSCTDGKVSVVYDSDGDTSTTTDWIISTYSNTGSFIYDVALETVSEVSYCGDTLYFATDNAIGFIEETENKATYIVECFDPSGMAVFDDGIYWIEDNTLMYAKHENGKWSDSITISENTGNMTNLAVGQTEDYTYAVYNSTKVNTNDDGTETSGLTDLMFTKINKYVDLKAYLYPVNEKSIIEQKEDNIELYVENNGNTTVDKVKVSLSDTLGNVVNKTVDITLLPGCGEVIKLTYAPKSGYTNTFLTVTVNAVSSVKEKTPDDNTLKEEIGLCDLLVEEISVDSVGDNYFLSAIISNNSFVSAEKVTVDTYFDSLETSAAKSRTVDSVACGENIFINIPVCKSNLSFDENGAAKVYVVVSSKSKENMTDDNTLCFIIRDDENKCGHPIKKLISTVESTCEKEGYNVYLCEACGKEITETIPIIDHDFSEWITEIEPTCTEMGIKYRVCSACGARETSNISANGHEYSDEWTIDKEATCITEGSKSHHCIHCDSKTDVTVIEKAEHQYGDWIVVKEATCNSEGTRSKVCSICNNVIKATIPKTQHNYVVSVVAPSCTENGYTIHTCSICGYSFTDGEVPAHHTDEDNDGICDICGTDLSPHDPATHCSCNCHKSGIVKFFWKIANFFRKIFKMEKYHYCDCGAAHW